MSSWATLVRTAVIGTERGALPDTVDSSPLGQLLAAARVDSAEHTLLRQAGLIAQYERAGQLPQQSNVQPDPVRTINTTTRQQTPLLTMFTNRYKELMPSYLAQLKAANQTVAPHYLPNMLTYGHTASHQAHAVIDVLGPHGRWLATQNPQWAYAAPDIDEWEGASRLWNSPQLKRRQSLLRQLRHRQPDLGRQLVESTWKSNTVALRLSLLRLFEINLSSADEPFLEAARTDRNLSVRRDAVRILCKMPNSRLAQRMTRATKQIFRWRWASKMLEIRFPVVITSQLTRDGVPMQLAKKNKVALRTEQLGAMVRPVPVDVWPDRLGISAETFLDAIQRSKWPRTLTNALIQAVSSQKNSAWADLILTKFGITAVNHKLVPILTPVQSDALAGRLAQYEEGSFAERGSQLLRFFANQALPWTPFSTRIWLKSFTTFLQSNPNRPITHASGSSLRRLARACPPELLDEAIEALLQLRSIQSWSNKIQEAINVLRFRKEMLDSILSEK